MSIFWKRRVSAVLLEDASVLLVGRRADAAGSPFASAGDQVRGVHQARCGTRADHGVDLVEWTAPVSFLISANTAETLLEVTAVLGTRDQRAEI